MKYVFTAVFTPEENGHISVDFPDLQGCYTTGENMYDVLYMAQDVLALSLYDMEQDNLPIPNATKPKDIKLTSGQFTSLVSADTETYGKLNQSNAA